jgi:hypothetical protein
MDLKIIEAVSKPLKVFKTTDEFNLFYHQNKESFDKQTTHLLNKQYRIEGYRITRIRGQTCLKRANPVQKVAMLEPETAGKVDGRLLALEKKVDRLTKTLNELIDQMGEGSDDTYPFIREDV